MTFQDYSARELEYLERIGRRETLETYFDWPQTHLSEFQEGRR